MLGGLQYEVVNAVKLGKLQEPLTTAKIRAFCKQNALPYAENYIKVFLPNGTSENHSLTYQKPFYKIAKGEYRIRREFL